MIDGERPIDAATNTAMIIERTQPEPLSLRIRAAASRKPGAALVLAAFRQVHEVGMVVGIVLLPFMPIGAKTIGSLCALIRTLVVGVVVRATLRLPFGVLQLHALIFTQARALLLSKGGISAVAMPGCTLRLELSLVEIGIGMAALTNVGSNAWFALRFALRELRSWFRFAATSTAFCGIMGVHIDLRSMCHSPGDGNRAGASACSYYSIGVR